MRKQYAEPVAWAIVRDRDGKIVFDKYGSSRLLRTEEIANEEAGRYMAYYGSNHSPIPLYTHHAAAQDGPQVTAHMAEYARAFLDDALKAMTQNIHGTPTTSMYVEDCIRKAAAALTP